MKILAINPLVPVVLKVHCDNGSIVDRVVFLDNENEIAYETNEELSVIDGELKQNLFNKFNNPDNIFPASASNDSIILLEKSIENFIKEHRKTEKDRAEEKDREEKDKEEEDREEEKEEEEEEEEEEEDNNQ